MNLVVTPEVLIKQFSLGDSKAIEDQVKNTINNTKNFDIFAKHLISFNDKLKHMNSYIALSNSKPYFKIKCDADHESAQIVEEFKTAVDLFAQKYHISLEKVDNKEVYYILGKND